MPDIIDADAPSNEWEARVALAAAYRVAQHFGWGYLIYNHIAQRVPGEDAFLVKPHDLLFEEVRASSLIKLPLRGSASGFSDNVNIAAYMIHTAILNARPDINCTLHVHTSAGMAISASKSGLLPITQNAMRFYNRVSYHDFEGYATEDEERARLASDLGPGNLVMILRNHGLLACGPTPSQAVFTMWNLVMCCESQLMLQASGAEIVLPSPEVCERSAQVTERLRSTCAGPEHRAFLRIIDKLDPSYRT